MIRNPANMCVRTVGRPEEEGLRLLRGWAEAGREGKRAGAGPERGRLRLQFPHAGVLRERGRGRDRQRDKNRHIQRHDGDRDGERTLTSAFRIHLGAAIRLTIETRRCIPRKSGHTWHSPRRTRPEIPALAKLKGYGCPRAKFVGYKHRIASSFSTWTSSSMETLESLR